MFQGRADQRAIEYRVRAIEWRISFPTACLKLVSKGRNSPQGSIAEQRHNYHVSCVSLVEEAKPQLFGGSIENGPKRESCITASDKNLFLLISISLWVTLCLSGLMRHLNRFAISVRRSKDLGIWPL